MENITIFVVVPFKSTTNPVEALQSWLYSSTPHSQLYTTGDTIVLINFLWITKNQAIHSQMQFFSNALLKVS